MSQNSLIFLDFDGVLNSHLFFKSLDGLSRSQDDHIDPVAVAHLNAFVDSGTKFIVTSTWRLGRTVDELQVILDNAGFKGEIIDTTFDMRRGEHSDCILRGNEVLQWIKAHPEICGAAYWDYRRYVILDDDSDFLYWQKDNLVLCDPYVGLTAQGVFRAKRILGLHVAIRDMA